MKFDHLIGLPWDYGRNDCFSLGRHFLMDNYGIKIPNYARPTDFWEDGTDLYTKLALESGFVKTDRTHETAWPGDIGLVCITHVVPEHGVIFLGQNKILHHVINQLSSVACPIPLWVRNGLSVVMRHKDMPDYRPENEEPIDVLKFLSPRARARFEALMNQIKT